ncbi:hypothetical protein GGI07_000983 [Coemansia sp. Benny D115]|nr:hypothetical protein GGI07_000983 [Coemansia sp. Benny D115]
MNTSQSASAGSEGSQSQSQSHVLEDRRDTHASSSSPNNGNISDDELSNGSEVFFETAEGPQPGSGLRQGFAEAPDSSLLTNGIDGDMPVASQIDGITAEDPLQKGVQLAMNAVHLFLSSDFERIEPMLNNRRHSLLYASEGYAAIQYLRAMMAFTREAMNEAQLAAENTINLAEHYRKPRGVGALLSVPVSRSESQAALSEAQAASDTNLMGSKDSSQKSRSWFRLDSPLLTLRTKKNKRPGPAAGENLSSVSAAGSTASLQSATSVQSGDRQPFDEGVLDSKYSDLLTTPEDKSAAQSASEDDEKRLDRSQRGSWASGLTNMADSLFGIVKAGTQAAGITKPDWHSLKSMTATQRHAELVHAEAYLLRAMLNVAIGDGILSVLKEGWHVRSAYATYRNCYTFIQHAHSKGEVIDDHFVSGTYFGMGVFNLILSMLPSKLLRFVELVGFSADRKLGLELLCIAAGWRSDPELSKMMEPAPENAESVHPCGYGLRSEFCSLVLQAYHIFLCNNMYIGYPNLPLVDTVLERAFQKHPNGLIRRYFAGMLLMSRTNIEGAIVQFDELTVLGNSTMKSLSPEIIFTPDPSPISITHSKLITELIKLEVSDAKAPSGVPKPENTDLAKEGAKKKSDWQQLQYLGYWERSLCYMAIGKWTDAAEGFNKLRKENNWNKAVYIYSLACCIWEMYLDISDGIAPIDDAERSEDQKRLFGIAQKLMASVPKLKRKVVGKSIPIEKFVIRKARKFEEQGGFLMRPGLELIASWNLFSKIPRERLQVLYNELGHDIEEVARHVPRGTEGGSQYRHAYYYDDLAVLLHLKGCVLQELATPSHIYNLAPPKPSSSKTAPTQGTTLHDESKESPELSVAAEDTFLRLLRLSPLIERDHYLVATSRFHLGTLYLARNASDSEWIPWACAQWKCILGGKPVSSPPFLCMDEYRAHKDRLQQCWQEHNASSNLFAAPACMEEEKLLQNANHPSLTFYQDKSSVSEWSYNPLYWSDSKKYSLQNALEVRTFNSVNRLNEALEKQNIKI